MVNSRGDARLTSARLSDYRKAAGLTQRELAIRAGTSVGMVRDLEQGRTRHPRPEALNALAGVLGLSPAQARDLAGADAERGLRLQVLGPLAAWRDGTAVTLGGPGQRAVLGLLALTPGSLVHRATIIDVLWPNDPPVGAVNLVQGHVSRLRRALNSGRSPGGDGVPLVSTGTAYQLQTGLGELDLLAFRQLTASARAAKSCADNEAACTYYQQAVELWQGDPLVDVELLRGYPAVAGLVRQRAEMVIEYAQVASAAGWHERVLAPLRELAAREPLNEQAHAQLMIAIAGTGQQAEALEIYQAIRRRLDEELAISPGVDLATAHQLVLRHGIAEAQSVALLPGGLGTAADPATPRELPGTSAHFVGRSAEIAVLAGMLDRPGSDEPGTAVISAIGGTAGVGKTALAIHWAHQVAHRFADGHLYVNLRGFDPSGIPAAPAEAIRAFLDALGVPADRIPMSLAAQAGLYRSLVADRQMLIVLDNARDEQQVRPLLPGSLGCLVIVTSRNQLSGLAATEGARLLTLDTLTRAEACQMLVAKLGERAAAEPEAVGEIADLCERLPLALAVAAARAVVHPRFPLADLATELRDRDTASRLDALDTGDPAANVRTVLSWSYRQLGPATARMFQLLGLQPGPDITVNAAASLAGVTAPAARRELRKLASVHLITEHSPGRYVFHDLLRAYASELAASQRASVRRAALARVLDYYLHTAHAAAALLNPLREPITITPQRPHVTTEHLEDDHRALAWLEDERHVLMSSVALAAHAGFDAYAWQLPWAMANFLDRRGYWHESDVVNRTALAAATRTGDNLGQDQARHMLSQSCVRLGDYDQARAHLAHCLELCRQCGDRAGEARAHQSLSFVAEHQGRYSDALHHDHQSLALFELINHRGWQAVALNAIGWHHALLGDPAQARVFCQQALDLNREFGIRHGEAACWDSLGYAEHQIGNLAQATAHYERALSIVREIGDRFNEAGVLTHLGDTRHAAGRQCDARDAWQQALDILDDLHHPDASGVRARLT